MVVLIASVTAGGALCARHILPFGRRVLEVSLRTTIIVEPFVLGDSSPPGWNAAAFKDTLSTRLAQQPGWAVLLESRESWTGGTMAAQYTMRGMVAQRDGRLVLSASLWRAGEERPMWTSTFWRGAEQMGSLAEELAIAATEAVHAETERRAVAAPKETR